MLLMNCVFEYNYFHHAMHKRDLKFYCTTLLALHAITWMMYDVTATVNVYYVSNTTGLGIASNVTYLHVRYFCDGLLDVAFTAHTSMLFLLISFWHTLFKSETASKLVAFLFFPIDVWLLIGHIHRFVSKWEFKTYIVYSIVSVVLYPTLQWSLLPLDDPRLPTVVPQFLYCGELILSSLLFLGVIYRMKKFGNMQRNSLGKTGSRTVILITTLCNLIYMLIFADLSIAFTLGILNIFYIIYPTPLEAHAAMTLGVWDFLTGLFSISFLSMIITVTLILNVGSLTQILQARYTTATTRTLSNTNNTSSSKVDTSKSDNSHQNTLV